MGAPPTQWGTPDTYKTILGEFVAALRNRLNAEFPVVTVCVRKPEPVRQELKACGRTIPRYEWVDTDDLPLFIDNLHIWKDGHVTLVNRIF